MDSLTTSNARTWGMKAYSAISQPGADEDGLLHAFNHLAEDFMMVTQVTHSIWDEATKVDFSGHRGLSALAYRLHRRVSNMEMSLSEMILLRQTSLNILLDCYTDESLVFLTCLF